VGVCSRRAYGHRLSADWQNRPFSHTFINLIHFKACVAAASAQFAEQEQRNGWMSSVYLCDLLATATGGFAAELFAGIHITSIDSCRRAIGATNATRVMLRAEKGH